MNTTKTKVTYVHILAVFIGDHDLGDEMVDVRRDRLLANVLDKLAELHGQPLLALHPKT